MSRSSLMLAAGDLLCFVAFAVIGLRSHEEGLTAGSFLRVVAPFAAAWAIAARLTGAFRPAASAGDAVRGVVITWGPAWLTGLAARSLIFGRSFFSTFAIVSLLFNAALLVGWRIAAASLLRAVPAPAQQPGDSSD